MSGFNPFRARNPDGSSAGATTSPPIPDNVSLDLFTKPAPSVPTQLPNGYHKRPSLSLELETDDSTSSDEQTADPFNPDSSVSDTDNEPGHDGNPQRRSSTSSALDDRPREFFGSSPHPAPSADGSTATPSFNLPFVPPTHTMRSGSGLGSGSSTPQEIVPPPVTTRDGGQTQTSRSPPEPGTNTSPSSRANKEKKPPPPPRSHHGKRISTSTNATANARVNAASSSSHTSPPRSTNRLSYHASSPESQISTRRAGTPNASSASQAPGADYFSFSVSHEDQQRARAPDSSYPPAESVQRSASQHSQHKRPPTPPLSRRHSQMRRSKSTQSKSSGSRLTMSSRDSESTDSSGPPSPGPSTRSVASSISDRKRFSMPPPSSSRSREREAEPRPAPGHSLSPDSLSPPPTTTRSNPPPPGRRASSHGSILSGSSPSSAAPPPPPPPRRARDSSSRSSEGRPVSQVVGVEEAPLPQPSNAQDILADLTRLQKEVDDLRGHYESRKVSQ
ncbi:hypothetical protein PoHVEF18_005399 [Penicillium ochrochloron]